MKVKALDLTKEFPESPKILTAGYCHLARMRDKARAKAAGTLGEYIYPCPLDQKLLGFLEIAPEVFYEAAQNSDDKELEAWVKKNAKSRPESEIRSWSEAFLVAKPDAPEKKEYFLGLLRKIDPSRTDIETWADLLDLDEKRVVPVRK